MRFYGDARRELCHRSCIFLDCSIQRLTFHGYVQLISMRSYMQVSILVDKDAQNDKWKGLEKLWTSVALWTLVS